MSLNKILSTQGKKSLNEITDVGNQNSACKTLIQKADELIIKPYKDVLNSILAENEALSREFFIGDLQGFKNLFKKTEKHFNVVDKSRSNFAKTYYSKRLTCYFDDNQKLKRFLVFDFKNKDIKIYNKFGKLTTHYTPEETQALMLYNKDSRDIHKVLRHNVKCKNVAETVECIENLKNIFKNGKCLKTKDKVIAYRALDKKSLQQLSAMVEGDILVDPSYVSVTTKKGQVLQFLNFRNFNKILRIEIPENTKYIDMDEIGNIVYPNAPENELLLEAGSKFLVKGKNGFFIDAIKLPD